MKFSDFNDRFQAFMSDLNANKELAVKENERPIVDLNRKQMRAGMNSEGQSIGVYASKAYDRYKKSIGSKSPAMIPDLLLTGAFQEAMILETEDTSYFITSTDEKTAELVGKYDNIFGLTKKSEEEAKQMNTKKLGELLKKALS